MRSIVCGYVELSARSMVPSEFPKPQLQFDATLRIAVERVYNLATETIETGNIR